jgi:hypothetical protein
MDINIFQLISRYFWLIGLLAAGYQYGSFIVRSRSHADLDDEPQRYKRWLAITSFTPWLIMGAGYLTGSTPTVWYYFRPQDLNPFVLVFVAWMFVLSVFIAYWVFFLDGARKAVELKLVHTNLQKPLNQRQVKLFAAVGPLLVLIWTVGCVMMNAPLRG